MYDTTIQTNKQQEEVVIEIYEDKQKGKEIKFYEQ